MFFVIYLANKLGHRISCASVIALLMDHTKLVLLKFQSKSSFFKGQI